MKFLEPSSEAALLEVYGADDLPARIESACTYMDAARVISHGVTPFEHPALEGPQEVGEATDGTWVWPLVASALFRAGVMWPSAEFLAHVEATGTPPTTLDDATIAEALEVASQT